jgi:sulfur-carrier protein adenylyltransferase/sulfurtransferase
LSLPPNATVGKELPALTPEEVSRYSRHLVMPEVGMDGQRLLKSASVLIIGAGGLGNPAATYLAAAGIGTIGLVDDDVIEKSNLHRQVLYSQADLGKNKVDTAKLRLHDVNPNVEVLTHKLKLDSTNALETLRDYDVIIDATDNFPTRYLVNDACVMLGKPDIYASIFRFDGQASVFDARKGPCYRCLYPDPPPPDSVPSCAEGGVLGVLPGIMGSIQAVQALNIVLGNGEPLIGRLLVFSASDTSFTELRIRKNQDCPVCGRDPTITALIDYEQFCGVRRGEAAEEVDPLALKAELDRGKRVLLLDVREPAEWQICRISGARLIPLRSLPERMKELDSAEEIVVYCHTGIRSGNATRFLHDAGFKKVRNLKGGIRAWTDYVDKSLTQY